MQLAALSDSGLAVFLLLAGQDAPPPPLQHVSTITVTASAGTGYRSAGDTDLCCSQLYRTDLTSSRSTWFGLAVGRRLTHAIGVEAELTWASEPQYVAFVQGEFAGAPYRGYRAANQIRSVSFNGLVRVGTFRRRRVRGEIVAGFGVEHENRVSQLDSIQFRVGPAPEPAYAFDNESSRIRPQTVLGFDVATSVARAAIVAVCRLHMPIGKDTARPDLDLGRPVFRLGVAVRSRF